ncbi:MAG: hypothetical protein BGO67_09830 [Alphaproteobacteria bacterium 41-28]|nr:MAG: hypothetical protein BGO67_09830 [Alphaproteobacteria bacterium 41-28]
MLNKVILQGNVGRIPTIKLTQSGRIIASFFLATNTYLKSRSRENGETEWQKCTEWHQITVFRESTVKWIKDALEQGDPLYVEGKLTYHHWADKYGQYHSTSHIVITNGDGQIVHLRPRHQKHEGTVLGASHSPHLPLNPIPDQEVSKKPDLIKDEKQVPDSSLENSHSTQPCPSELPPETSSPPVEDRLQRVGSEDTQQKENN